MSPLSVILIDDDDLVRAVLVECLQDAGFQVRDFSDPEEALGTFGSGRPPNVLITDVDLGSALNGFDVAGSSTLACRFGYPDQRHAGQPHGTTA